MDTAKIIDIVTRARWERGTTRVIVRTESMIVLEKAAVVVRYGADWLCGWDCLFVVGETGNVTRVFATSHCDRISGLEASMVDAKTVCVRFRTNEGPQKIIHLLQ